MARGSRARCSARRHGIHHKLCHTLGGTLQPAARRGAHSDPAAAPPPTTVTRARGHEDCCRRPWHERRRRGVFDLIARIRRATGAQGHRDAGRRHRARRRARDREPVPTIPRPMEIAGSASCCRRRTKGGGRSRSMVCGLRSAVTREIPDVDRRPQTEDRFSAQHSLFVTARGGSTSARASSSSRRRRSRSPTGTRAGARRRTA